MIRRVENLSEYHALWERDSVFAARLCTQYAACAAQKKGTPLEFDFYEAGQSAMLCICEGVLTICGEVFDEEELRAFIRLRSCATVACSAQAAAHLNLAGSKNVYTIMHYTGGAAKPDAAVSTSVRLDDVFKLLCNTFEGMQGAQFDRWYCDIFWKIQQKLAFVCGIYENGVLAATAGVYYQNNRIAVLGSVATRPECRGRGLAGRLLQTLLWYVQTQGKTPEIVCLNDHAKQLYLRTGFLETGKFVEIKPLW